MRLGRYETSFRLASGGMAEVYVGRLVGEGGFQKPVAIKRMLPHLAADERFVGMFLDEGRLAANISSPHVVSTLELGRADDDSLFLVMELVVGTSLATLVRAGEPVPVPVAVELLAQAATGLHDAHEARTLQGEWLRIVHRDVSPQNILVDVTGRARITDFGVARAIERVTQTQSGEVKGKLAYFAPEQARAQPLDRRADVFALAVVAWEVLAGERLFVGEGPADTLQRVLQMPIPRLDARRPDVPPAIADAIARALDRDVHVRTESAERFASELRSAVSRPSSSELAAFVRARGGAVLHEIEEGLRRHASPALGRLAHRAPHVASEGASRRAAAVPSAEQMAPPRPRAPIGSRTGWIALAVGLTVAGVVALAASQRPAPSVRIVPLPAATPLADAPRATPLADALDVAPAGPSAPSPSLSPPATSSSSAAGDVTAERAVPRARLGHAPSSFDGLHPRAARLAPEPASRAPRALRSMDDFEADIAQ